MMIDRRSLMLAMGACALPLGSALAAPLAEVRTKGRLTIATTGANAPYTFVGPDNQLRGYDIDWARLITQGLGVQAEFVRLEWRGILPGLIAGQFDTVMSAVRVTPERQQQFDMSAAYGTDDIVVVVPNTNTAVKEIEDLRGLVVGAATGSVQEQVARELANARDLRSYPGLPDIMMELRNGRLEAAVVGRGGAAHFIRTTSAPLKIVGRPLRPGPIGMVMRKGSTELLAAIDAVIAARVADGSRDRLIAQWFQV
jgi:ABC-type amino acid transport substrate-binding protein